MGDGDQGVFSSKVAQLVETKTNGESGSGLVASEGLVTKTRKANKEWLCVIVVRF